jgi:hypothetical protein
MQISSNPTRHTSTIVCKCEYVTECYYCCYYYYIRVYIIICYIFGTEYHRRVVTTPALYSGGPEIESRT